GRHAARITGARAYGGEGEPARDGDRSGTVGRQPIAECAETVVTPAVGGPASRHAARLSKARAHGGEGVPARDCDRSGTVGGRPIAELAEEVLAPTVGGPAGCHAARVEVAGTQSEVPGRDGHGDVEAAADGP